MPSDTVKQLETFFDSFDTLPTIPDTAGEVDLNIAVPVHLSYLKNNSGNIVFLPYYQRLVKWRKYLEEHEKNEKRTIKTDRS
jgi:hypothetical protein